MSLNKETKPNQVYTETFELTSISSDFWNMDDQKW